LALQFYEFDVLINRGRDVMRLPVEKIVD